jgi:mannose-6-phosphate isomerase-like protein (cupin superfamily)
MWVDPPGRVWSDFEHDRDELILLVDGELEIEVGADTVRPLVGEEVLVPAGARHTVRNAGSGVARWLYGYRLVQP